MVERRTLQYLKETLGLDRYNVRGLMLTTIAMPNGSIVTRILPIVTDGMPQTIEGSQVAVQQLAAVSLNPPLISRERCMTEPQVQIQQDSKTGILVEGQTFEYTPHQLSQLSENDRTQVPGNDDHKAALADLSSYIRTAHGNLTLVQGKQYYTTYCEDGLDNDGEKVDGKPIGEIQQMHTALISGTAETRDEAMVIERRIVQLLADLYDDGKLDTPFSVTTPENVES